MNSFVAPTGRSVHSCGYCHSPGDTSISHGMWAYAMTPMGYQDLIDTSWRRSGSYIYKPNMNTCCPAYTIRLNASLLQLSKSQKKTIKKMKKYILDEGIEIVQRGDQKKLSQLTGKSELCNLISEAEGGVEPLGHNIRVDMVPSDFDQECFELYCKYQTQIHLDSPDKLSVEGYRRFLVDSPIFRERLPVSFPGIPTYGSYHQKYYMDNVLIAVAVLDILPFCVSSVYFFYDPDYSILSLGVYAALREIALTESLNMVLPMLKYYYMGYYIHSCSKMRYKGDYKPSELLCPFTFKWIFLSDAIPLLERNPTSSLVEPFVEYVEPNPKNVSEDAIGDIKVYFKQNVVRLKIISSFLKEDQKDEIKRLADILGSLSRNYIIVV